MRPLALDQKHVQGWNFTSLFLRLCWFHVPVTVGIIASILSVVFNNKMISAVVRTLIQATSKPFGVSVLNVFLSFPGLVPLTLFLVFGTNPVPISTFLSTNWSLMLGLGSLPPGRNLHQVACMAPT
jgi:hypothetical protein